MSALQGRNRLRLGGTGGKNFRGGLQSENAKRPKNLEGDKKIVSQIVRTVTAPF
jgi:hypothetical protein